MNNEIELIKRKSLIRDRRLHPSSKLVYDMLDLHPKNTIRNVANMLEVPYSRLWRGVQELKRYDWLYESTEPETGRTIAIPSMPLDVEERMVRSLQQRRSSVGFIGEWLMGQWLNFVVDDRYLRVKSRPEWLVSGDGGRPLELDFWFWKARVAIEFQGRHHFEADATRAEQEKLLQQQRRDGLKSLLCARNSIRFIEIAGRDLTYDTLLSRLKGVLPLIPPREERPLFRFLAQTSRSYANYLRRDGR